VSSISPTDRGTASDLTAIVACEKGRFFIKGMYNKPGGRRDSIARERLINPFVHPISPPVLWSAEDAGWIVLGFEFVSGRHADFAPGSQDLPRVVELVKRIGELELPGIARDWGERRWDWYTTSNEEVELLRGDSLLYADVHPANFIMGDNTAWAVDWSWPTMGAAFIDPAMCVTQLIGAGHSPDGAEEWVSDCRAWRQADPKAIDVFAAASVRMWREIAERAGNPEWALEMVASVQGWADHRGVDVS
jgi:hypothetical protein